MPFTRAIQWFVGDLDPRNAGYDPHKYDCWVDTSNKQLKMWDGKSTWVVFVTVTGVTFPSGDDST